HVRRWPMIGDAGHDRGDRQIRIADEIGRGHHFFADVILVAHRELVAPQIEAVAELAAAGPILELSRAGPKAHHAAGRAAGGRIGTIRKAELASTVPEFLWKDDRGRRTLMRKIDPVVETVDRVVDRVLWIGEGKTGQYNFSNVGLAVAVRVFKVQDIRRVRD